jgi:Ca2+-binding EF-hand superfamily protein
LILLRLLSFLVWQVPATQDVDGVAQRLHAVEVQGHWKEQQVASAGAAEERARKRAALIDQEFSRMDLDRSGLVDRNELRQRLEMHARSKAENNVRAFIQNADVDLDGMLSPAEAWSFTQDRAFRGLDVDSSGFLERDELGSEQEEGAFDKFDLDHDGKLSKAEALRISAAENSTRPETTFLREFGAADLDSNGFLEKAEIVNHQISDSGEIDEDKALEEYDLDNDGQLSKDELVEATL